MPMVRNLSSDVSILGRSWAVLILSTLLFSCSHQENQQPTEGSRSSKEPLSFRVEPVRPVAELRQEALLASPPEEQGDFIEPDLIELSSLDPTLQLNIRYATANNFLGTPLYQKPRAYLQRPAALALIRVHRELQEQGLGILVFDAYRPWFVTKIFWEATPAHLHQFVADPTQGSRHNRGAAVDLSLFHLDTGMAVDMPSGYDEFTDRAHPDYEGGTREQRRNRDRLIQAMESAGFQVYEFEWWHFDFENWRRYPILNLTFDEVDSE